jgi:Acetyltransferase (GNAT) domain
VLVIRGRFTVLSGAQLWWPDSAADVFPIMRSVAVATVRQCDRVLADDLARFAFRIKQAPTAVVDLTATEEALWEGLDRKSCRYEIRKSREIDAEITRNEDTERARSLVNAHRRRTGYARLISPADWKNLSEYVDVFVVAYEGAPVAAHVVLVDKSRARLLLSATADRAEVVDTRVIGRLNRLLHWHELLHYKACGFSKYDFGGVEDRSSPVYSVTQFKLSFGGDVVDEVTLALAWNPFLRRGLRIASGVRGAYMAVRKARQARLPPDADAAPRKARW